MTYLMSNCADQMPMLIGLFVNRHAILDSWLNMLTSWWDSSHSSHRNLIDFVENVNCPTNYSPPRLNIRNRFSNRSREARYLLKRHRMMGVFSWGLAQKCLFAARMKRTNVSMSMVEALVWPWPLLLSPEGEVGRRSSFCIPLLGGDSSFFFRGVESPEKVSRSATSTVSAWPDTETFWKIPSSKDRFSSSGSREYI